MSSKMLMPSTHQAHTFVGPSLTRPAMSIQKTPRPPALVIGAQWAPSSPGTLGNGAMGQVDASTHQSPERAAPRSHSFANFPVYFQAKPLSQSLQREVINENEDHRAPSILSGQAVIEDGEASPRLTSAINRAKGGGQPLDTRLQQSTGRAMGADFSRVKVLAAAQADQLNQSIQAKSFTTGQDVFFRQRAYQPGSREGQPLIPHQLTHVVQPHGGAAIRSHLLPQQLTARPTTVTPPAWSGERAIQEKANREGKRQDPSLAQRPNQTGLPDHLKSGIESLSGIALDNVKVHYNSAQPAQLNALAYARGNDIHVAPGQEQHLPHEAWHVVQQAQGRVRPTMQMKGDVPVNNEVDLEAEADAMGVRALEAGTGRMIAQWPIARRSNVSEMSHEAISKPPAPVPGVVQAKWIDKGTFMEWDSLLGGLQWYFQKATDQMMFKIIEKNKDEDLHKTLEELAKQKHTYDQWIKEWKDFGWIDPDEVHKKTFSDYVDRIVSAYPIDTHIYIGIGASCDLLLEYIKLKYKAVDSVSIPISKANESPTDGSESWTAEQYGRLHTYIASTVGDKAINATDKKLLVMDVTSGGSSLRNICEALEAVLRKSGKGPDRVQRLSLNATIAPDMKLKIPIAGKSSSPGSLREENMGEREFTEQERRTGIVKKGSRWVAETVFDEIDNPTEETSSDTSEGPEESPSHVEYYPSEYDAFIKGLGSDIGKKLDDMDYKKLGRIYEKIPMKDVMEGKITDSKRFYNKKGYESIVRYAKRLLGE